MNRSIRSVWTIGAGVAASVVVIAVGFVLWNAFGFSPSPIIHESGSAFELASENEAATPVNFAIFDKPRPLPDMQFVDKTGVSGSLAGFRGHPLVLNIWATWCVPCRKEMPTLDHLQRILAGSDALVVPLSIDSKGVPAVASFYQEIGIKSLGIYVDSSGKTSSELATVGVPTTLLVDRDGREIGRKLGAAEWDSPEMVRLIRTHLQLRLPEPAAGRQP